MKRLIDEADFAHAFAFGQEWTWRLIREHLLIYVAMGISLAALLAWAAIGAAGFQKAPGAFITFPALAAAVRLAKPDYRMRFSTVISLIGIWLLVFSPFIVLFFIGVAVGALRVGHAVTIAQTFGLLIFLCVFVSIFVYLWISIKFSAAWTFYALCEDREASILSAMAKSWTFLSGDMWWRVFGLAVAIGLICQLLPGIAARALFAGMGGTSSFAAVFLWALIVYTAAVPATVWLHAAYVALVSTDISQSDSSAVLSAMPGQA